MPGPVLGTLLLSASCLAVLSTGRSSLNSEQGVIGSVLGHVSLTAP